MRKRALSLFLALVMALSCMVSPVAAAELSAAGDTSETLAVSDTIEVPDASEPVELPEEVPAVPEETPADSPEGDSSTEELPPAEEEETPAEGETEAAPEEESAPDVSVPEEEAAPPEEAPAEALSDEEAPEETLNADVTEDTDPIHKSIAGCTYTNSKNKKVKCAKLVSDELFDEVQTVTAATLTDYENTTGLAEGAVISYKRLVTLKPTGLVKSSDSKADSKTNSNILAAIMSNIVKKYSRDPAYADVVFKVQIPKGKYYLGYCLYLYTNTWLSMENVTFYRNKSTFSATASMARTYPSTVTGYTGEHNILLQGGTWDCIKKNYSYKSASHFGGILRFGHNENVLLSGVTINGAVNGHHVEICGTRSLTFVGCTMKGYVNTAHHGDTDFKEAIQLDITNNADTCPGYERFDDTTTQNVVIYKNTFKDCCRGIGGHSAVYGKKYSGIVVDSNTFTNLSGVACHMLNYADTAVIRNTMTKVGGGVELLGMCKSPDGHFYRPASGVVPAYSKVQTFQSNSIISDNVIEVNPATSKTLVCGILVGGEVHNDTNKSIYCYSKYHGKTFTMTDVTIENNVIRNAKDAGILLKYAKNCTVSGNTVDTVSRGQSWSGYGLLLHHCGEGVHADNNTVSGTQSHGIYVRSSGGIEDAPISLTGCTVSNVPTVGVYFEGSSYVSLTSSSVTAKGFAVQVDKSHNLTIGAKKQRNTLVSEASYGIYTGGSSSAVTLSYNDVSAKKAISSVHKNSSVTTKSNTFTPL